MVAPRTPNYCLNQEFVYNWDIHDKKSLPNGSFVRPIELCYIPQHILDIPRNKSFDPEKEIYCYTRYGIMAIPKHMIREV